MKDVFTNIDLSEHRKFIQESTIGGVTKAAKKMGSILEFRWKLFRKEIKKQAKQ